MNNCKPNKDFMRNIVNIVVSEYSGKISSNVVEDIKKRLGYAEAKYKFSIYGGNPLKIIDYLKSEDWNDLVSYVKSIHVEDLLKSILERLYNEYKNNCQEVSEFAKNLSESLNSNQEKKDNISFESIVNSLKLYGYQPEVMEKEVMFKDGNVSVRILLNDGSLSYTICKEGKAQNLDSIMQRTNKIKEI
ncbi:hypothetical protein Calag_0478 [Caldisphaera lagunensis DSM 15908]|uniref:Uncharacterized protein n=1 Tax=Caldisphaera lagunensis (strain DSM 15908 / JCM 11604 / ANMR 0165 / IC-154) TaxID=1056495 RepID=L0A9Z6_CALLD|nr:hypothetical protein [Caldisphaera lagunensis]AFZ70244.1 hypothetical protein Calag_0478 [Caldisphaera lagunensis DSM 15908]